MTVQIPDELRDKVREAARVAAANLVEEFDREAGVSIGKPVGILVIRRYADILVEYAVAQFDGEIQKLVQENTRRIVIAVFDDFISGKR